MPSVDDADPRAPAPGRLALIQDLVNSVDLPDGVDQLASPAGAAAWLTGHGVDAAATITDRDRRGLVEVREALRLLLLAHTGEPVDGDVAEVLMRHLNGPGLSAVISMRGATLAAANQGVDGLFAQVLAGIVEATADGTWDRLKACREDDCRFAFYDRSKNGCGAWCSMRVCGSRHKARAYRERQRVAARASA